ncbi:hypothetical protein PYCC9005_002741 [Savitreella phatthalungensis]
MQAHPEGGFFVETDRSTLDVTVPWDEGSRASSTSIFYLLANATSLGANATDRCHIGYFHRNVSRTVHSLHRGRGAYLVLSPPGSTGKVAGVAHSEHYQAKTLASGWQLEYFKVGQEFAVYQWLVEGGKYKCSFLEDEEAAGLFITEVVSPGFEFADHDFMGKEIFTEIFGADTKMSKYLRP